MIVHYLRLAVWPHPLIADYGVTAADDPGGRMAIAGVAGACWRPGRWPCGDGDRRWPSSATWFFVTLAPASSVVPIVTEVGAQRRMYLPLIALVVLGVLGVRAAIGRWVPTSRRDRRGDRRQRPSAWAALTAVSAARGLDYRDSLRDLAERPRGAAARPGLPQPRHRAGGARPQTDEAMAAYRRAAETLPEARYSLGYALAGRGDDQAAIAELREFLARRPDDASAPLATNLLGMLLARQGDIARRHRGLRAHADDAAGGRRRPPGPRRRLHRPRRRAGRGGPARPRPRMPSPAAPPLRPRRPVRTSTTAPR